MGAYYASFEHEVAGYELATVMSGKALSRTMKELDAICGRLGVVPLSSFYSESNAEAFEKIGEPMPPDMRDEPIKWSEAADGLRTIDALLESSCEPKVARDLEDLRRVLLVASEHGTRFRLRIDI